MFDTDFSLNGSASSSISKSVPSPTDAGSNIFVAYSTAQANYGSFNLHSSVDLKNFNGHSYFEESSNCSACVYNPSSNYARFYETFTITGGTGTGYLRISADVDAEIAASNPQGNLPIFNYQDEQGNISTHGLPGDLEARFKILGGNNAIINSYNIQNDTFNVVRNLIQFTYNQPFALGFEAITSIFPGDYIPSTEIYDYSANVNLAVNLANFSVFNDVDGLNQTNFSLTSSSGKIYPVTVLTSVPEADSYAMLIAGLGVLGFVARRKKTDLIS